MQIARLESINVPFIAIDVVVLELAHYNRETKPW